ncbi:hypothetical protein [Streptomyces virginiae]|uniref:hypothetical protein n=1 Tax=Streptomyces virginiae TaxID=1961 RepID=UPI00131B6ECF|nr:hypothetical protein [Streptomyces virginiae]
MKLRSLLSTAGVLASVALPIQSAAYALSDPPAGSCTPEDWSGCGAGDQYPEIDPPKGGSGPGLVGVWTYIRQEYGKRSQYGEAQTWHLWEWQTTAGPPPTQEKKSELKTAKHYSECIPEGDFFLWCSSYPKWEVENFTASQVNFKLVTPIEGLNGTDPFTTIPYRRQYSSCVWTNEITQKATCFIATAGPDGPPS